MPKGRRFFRIVVVDVVEASSFACLRVIVVVVLAAAQSCGPKQHKLCRNWGDVQLKETTSVQKRPCFLCQRL